MRDRAIKRRGVSNPKYSAGIGYIIIPTNTDRAAYVQKCLRTGTVGILTETGGIIWNVHCNKSDLGFLEFPLVADLADKASLGTAVVWVNLPSQDNPMIVALVERYDEGTTLLEHQFKIIREFNGGHVTISGRGDKGELSLDVMNEASTGGTINISATNLAKSAEINLFTQGQVNIEALGKINLKATDSLNVTIKDRSIDDKETTIQYVKGAGLSYKDEFDNEILANEEKIQIKAVKEVDLGSGKEAMVLGDTAKQFISDLIDQIKAITVPTAFGPSGTPINAPAIASLVSSSLDKILSTYSKTE
jgi:hypothetical protein